MPPKPFPSQIRIGTDICHKHRIQNLFGKGEPDRVRRLASKLFSRLEWPFFESKFQGPEGPFLQWLAGRWAAKEAAIKSHSHRALLRTEISILPGVSSSDRSSKPRLLIDPPARFVVMNASTAAKRGLKPYPFMTSTEINATQGITSLVPDYAEGAGQRTSSATGRIYRRRRLIRDEERQEADLSISHDGDYAFAVCLALNEEVDSKGQEYKPVIDHGIGESIHEPEFGDAGFEGGWDCGRGVVGLR